MSTPRQDEDLFANSTMTFGEHLEELRGSLGRALIGVVIAFLVALFFASTVVRWIQGPLEDALTRFNQDRGHAQLQAAFDGKPPEELTRMIDEDGLTPEKMYLQSDELAKLAAGDKASSPIQLVPITVWRPTEQRIKALNAHEPFMIWIKAAVITGVILSSPWIFWQIWQFVAAGLYPNEKRYVYSLLPFAVGLFLAGSALAFFFVFEPVLDFLLQFNRTMNIDPDPRIGEWISFVLFLPIGFGLSFQLPLVMLLLERIGITTRAMYISNWRIAVVVICVISMLLTPADPVSMLMMAVPLTGLYFLGIAICRWAPGSSPTVGYDPTN